LIQSFILTSVSEARCSHNFDVSASPNRAAAVPVHDQAEITA
jgi:hypothetical protein